MSIALYPGRATTDSCLGVWPEGCQYCRAFHSGVAIRYGVVEDMIAELSEEGSQATFRKNCMSFPPRLKQAPPSVDHAQDPPGAHQASGFQIGGQRAANLVILGETLPKAQGHLLTVHVHAQRNETKFAGGSWLTRPFMVSLFECHRIESET